MYLRKELGVWGEELPQPSDRKPGEGRWVLVGRHKAPATLPKLPDWPQTQGRKGITEDESGQQRDMPLLLPWFYLEEQEGGWLYVKVQRSISRCLLLAVQP